jgi:hypothetical protein
MTTYRRSSRDTYLQRLTAGGYVQAQGDRIVPTAEGIAALGDDFQALPTGDELRQHWLGILPEGEKRILHALIECHPEDLARDELDEITGYKRSSRDTYLQRMMAKMIVVESGRGRVKASETLFEGVAAESETRRHERTKGHREISF